MKETATDYVDYLLKLWAYWELKFNSGDIGWPSSSPAIMALEQGTDFKTKQFRSKMPPFNEAADRMRYILNHYLQQDLPGSAHAIREVYLNQHIKPNDIAFKYGVCLRTLNKRLHEGRIYLHGCVRTDPFFQSDI